MNINATLLGEIIIFMGFVGLTLRYVWPPLAQALDERHAGITQALQEAESARNQVQTDQKQAQVIIKEAREKADGMIQKARKQAEVIVHDAEHIAREKEASIYSQGQQRLQQQKDTIIAELTESNGELVVSMLSRILEKEFSNTEQARLLNALKAEGET